MSDASQEGPLQLDDLPDDCLFHILSYLTSANDLMLARLVNKRWNKVGSEHQWRVYACKRCLTPLFHPAHHVAPVRNHAHFSGLPEVLKPEMADGRTMLLRNIERCNLDIDATDQPSDPNVYWLLHKRGWGAFARAQQEGHMCMSRTVRCPGCRIYLGFTISSMPQQAIDAVEYENDEKGIDPHMVAGLDINHPSYLLEKAYICRWFVRFIRGDGSPDPWKDNDDFFLNMCSGARRRDLKNAKEPCGNLLFDEDAILSRDHVWRAAGSDVPEPAYYLNSVVAGAVTEKFRRVEDLAQGKMEVADLFCAKCGGSVGWKFLSTLPGHRDLEYSCGRVGIVASSAATLKVKRADGTDTDTLRFEDLPLGLLRPEVRADKCFPEPRDLRVRGATEWKPLAVDTDQD